jgi:hypothetical protein
MTQAALVVDRTWNLLLTNSAADAFLEGVDAALLEPPVNMMRLGLHPGGFAPRVINLPQVRARLLTRLARQAHQAGDLRLAPSTRSCCPTVRRATIPNRTPTTSPYPSASATADAS